MSDARTLPLHRAFSLFIFDSDTMYGRGGRFGHRMLIQRRSLAKATFPGLWSNSCCSHPLSTDTSAVAAIRRRVREELGLQLTNSDDAFQLVGKIIYHATSSPLESNKGERWGEHELDYLYFYVYDGPLTLQSIKVNSDEVSNIRWVTSSELMLEIEEHPDNSTPWFKTCVKDWLLGERALWNHLIKGSLPPPIPNTPPFVYSNPLT